MTSSDVFIRTPSVNCCLPTFRPILQVQEPAKFSETLTSNEEQMLSTRSIPFLSVRPAANQWKPLPDRPRQETECMIPSHRHQQFRFAIRSLGSLKQFLALSGFSSATIMPYLLGERTEVCWKR